MATTAIRVTSRWRQSQCWSCGITIAKACVRGSIPFWSCDTCEVTWRDIGTDPDLKPRITGLPC